MNPLKKTLRNLSTMLWIDRSAWFSYSISLALALCFVSYLLPLAFFAGNSVFFDPNISDNALHMSSWWYFAQDTWRIPLLLTNRTDYPVGQNIAFTDSIPLAAIFFKFLLKTFPTLLPPHFHYFGWWIGLAFILQALSAVTVSRALNGKSLINTIAASIFALTWPPLHVRYPHTALMMQCIVVFSLALYFLAISNKLRINIALVSILVINIVALLIHPYFVVFTFGIYMALLFDIKRVVPKYSWLSRLAWLSVMVLILMIVGSSFGYLGLNTVGGGYGDGFSFDLAAPFCGDTKWSKCAYLRNGEDARHFEGYNYLGAGLLLIMFVALFLIRKTDIKNILQKHLGLILICIGLFAYAITHVLKFKGVTLSEFPLPEIFHWLTGTFRAAGRFFWLIGYVLLFVILAILTRHKNFKIAVLILISLSVQYADMLPKFKFVKELAATPGKVDYKEWTEVYSKIDKVNMYPLWGCNNDTFNHISAEYIYQITGYYAKLINSGYTARLNVNCERGEGLKTNNFEPRNLYAIGLPKDLGATLVDVLPKPFLDAVKREECVEMFNGIFCLPGSNPNFWAKSELPFRPIELNSGRKWYATSTNTQIGQVMGRGSFARIQPKDQTQPGWLSFGPSVSLPTGKYRYTLDYASNSTTDQQVGTWDLNLNNETPLTSGALIGTKGQIRRIEGTINIPEKDAHKPFEIRTFFLAKGDLQFISSSIQKVQ